MESRHGLSSGGFHVHCHACASCLAKNGGKRLFLAEEMKGRIRWLQRGVAQLDAAHACIWVCMHVAPAYSYICVRTCFADVHCCIGFYSKFWCCAPSSNFDQRSLFNQSRTSQRRFSYRLILRFWTWFHGGGGILVVSFCLQIWMGGKKGRWTAQLKFGYGLRHQKQKRRMHVAGVQFFDSSLFQRVFNYTSVLCFN